MQAQNVEDVVAIADALGWDRFAVAGASGGSAPALAVAALRPERVTRCAVIVGASPSTVEEIQAAMGDDDRREWERAARGDENELAQQFDDFGNWVDAGMPDIDGVNRASRRMLEEAFGEARRQGPGGYIDDLIADAHDWGFAVEDVGVPTKIMAAREDSPFMHVNSRWLAGHIPGAELYGVLAGTSTRRTTLRQSCSPGSDTARPPGPRVSTSDVEARATSTSGSSAIRAITERVIPPR